MVVIRAVIESDNQVQSQKDYLPLLDISTNQAKQTTHTLHIGTHIFSKISKNNTSKSVVDCWVSVLRLLFGWIARVCCHVLLCAWCERKLRLSPVS
jgi:hypothetical protein